VLFHMRAGHPGERVSKLLAANYNTGLNGTVHGAHVEHYVPCRLSKSTKPPANPSTNTLQLYECFQLILSDIFGPVTPAYAAGLKYAIHFTCAATRYCRVYFVVSRDEAASKFSEFVTRVHSPGYKTDAIVLRTDNDTVYRGGDLPELCEALDIRQQFTGPYVHFNAAIAERLSVENTVADHSENSGCGVFDRQGALVPGLRAYAAYMYIRRPHTTLEVRTPYELLHHEQPSLAHRRVFGCTASTNA